LANYFNSFGVDKTSKSLAEREIEKLFARQKARETDVRRLQSAEVNSNWVSKLLKLFAKIHHLPHADDIGSVSQLQRRLVRCHHSPLPTRAREAAANLQRKDADDFDDSCALPAPPRRRQVFKIEHADENSDLPYYFDEIDQCKYPIMFRRISEASYLNEKKTCTSILQNKIAGLKRV
jgi:hypothetical protein